MAFPLNTPFYSIPGAVPSPTFGIMMEILLKARVRLHLETQRPLHDDDVNTYLAGLLVSYIDPIYLQGIFDLVSRYEIDVCQAVEKAEDKVQIYWIYKANADDLLVTLGIFRKLRQQPGGELSRMERYYTSASEYQRRIYGKATAVGEIQAKLAEEGERYLRILSAVRSEYLHFIQQADPQELTRFGKEILQLEQDLPLKAQWDQFLDLYSQWLKGNRKPDCLQRLKELAQELKQLDPSLNIKI